MFETMKERTGEAV